MKLILKDPPSRWKLWRVGEVVEPSKDKNLIAQRLEQLNAVLAEKNKRSRRIWKIVMQLRYIFREND